jgi:hypothetical protein
LSFSQPQRFGRLGSGWELYENTVDVRDAIFTLLCKIAIVLKI